MKKLSSFCLVLGLLLFSITAFSNVDGLEKNRAVSENYLTETTKSLMPDLLPEPPVTITGRVLNEEGKPLASISVVAKGTKRGVTTNEDGYYSIVVDENDQVLVFSGIGVSPLEVAISGRAAINVTMESSTVAMERVEIVHTGMQRREQNKMIGSVSTVTAADIENAGITSIDKALKGKMAGVYVRSASGRPGETGEIVIRGINTMTGNKEPLYILDGMPLQTGEVAGGVNNLLTNGIGNIPPEDIESISILKDATAASIYGARAANGVIIITTKVGEVGKDYVSYTGKVGVNYKPQNKFSFMNSAQKLAYERGIYDDYHPIFGGRANLLLFQADNGVISRADAEAQINELSNINTNWIDELYRPALIHSHNVTMSGGTFKTQYNISANFQNSQGTLIANGYQSGGLNMKVSRRIADKLLVNVNLYSTVKKNVEGASELDPFKYALFANPYEKPYNEDGSYSPDMTYRNLSADIGLYSDLNYLDFNMIRELRENTRTNLYGNVRGQLGIEYSFLKHFRYNGTAVFDYTSVHNMDESMAGTYRSWANNWLNRAATQSGRVLPEFNQGFLSEDMGRTINYTVRNSLEFNKTFGGKHFTQLFVANEVGGQTNYQFNHFNPVYLQEYRMAGYPSWNSVLANRYQNLDLPRFGNTFFAEDRRVSFIGSGVYSYDNRYVFNANLRNDGVDIIGSKNQFTPLWSAGVRWNAHNEEFLKNNSVISRLVLSAGYGYRGSINRSVYPFHIYGLSTTIYGDVIRASEFRYGNPVLKWEKKKDLNLGMELSLFKGRVNIETRYFDEKIVDLLDDVRLPASVGRASATVNTGSLSNKGVEIGARLEVLKSSNMLWEVGGNFTTVKNNLDKVFYNEMPNVASALTRNVEGYPINSWFGYKVSHVNPDNGHLMVKALREDNELVGGKVVTTYTEEVIDLHTISTADLQAKYRTYSLGHIDPEYYGGFNTRFVYSSFEIAGNFVYAGGNKILGFQDRKEGPGGQVDEITASRTNRTVEQLNRWRQPHDVTDIPAYSRSATSYTRFLVDSDLEDGSYLKCTELAFSWRAKPTVLGNSIVKTLKASVIANNLFTLSTYSGTDPETRTTFGYPTTPSLTFLLNVGF